MKNSSPVPKPTSPRDSQPDDLDTVLVVSSEEIAKARAAVESITSETATIDCHPVILDDSEEDTDRFLGERSSSGLVQKKPLKKKEETPVEEGPKEGADGESDSATLMAPLPAMTMVDEEEELELSLSGVIEEMPTRERVVDAMMKGLEPEKPKPESTARPKQPKSEPREIETQVIDPSRALASAPPADEDTATTARPKTKQTPRFDDETKPMPKVNLGDIGGALETVPLNAALVQNVLAQVDARAAARQAGRPVPEFQLSPVNPHVAPPTQQQSGHGPPNALVQTHPTMQGVGPIQPAPAPRRIGVEIIITIIAFLAVAVPALYFLYVTFIEK